MMAGQPLFPEPASPRVGPLGYVEAPVRWFKTSTRPQAVASRAAVNAWYAEFPDDPGRKLAKRLRSSDGVAHFGALDELYVHHLLRRRFDDVRYEEDGKGPDFRVYERGVCVAAVEVLSLFEPPDWAAPQTRHGRIADQLNKAVKPTAGYFVRFEVIRGQRDPSPKAFARFIENELEQLPPPEQVPHQASPHRAWAHWPRAIYREESGTQIAVTFIPMKPEAPSRTNPDARLASSNAFTGGIVLTAQRLKERVREKAGGRYDITGIPYAVVAGIHDFPDEEEIIAGIFGRTCPQGRDNTGLFGIDSERPDGRYRRLSAVIALTGLPLWDTAAHDVALLPNPHATHPWPLDAIPARNLAPEYENRPAEPAP
ncbi:hypothetical protein KDK95_05650 [Actinospica sp. MGRD01-02]|uniref:Uncharacterized protein n=1 Tax=Actinospica acidithermotolerans TaxID=2828514 RepID=A0A941EDG9_9ACTN|nr:hypothetical protein [Actinospica acidithermotolerans]MBR7825784.1 hypothetical protein [Actinospica acidithermotolerans]